MKNDLPINLCLLNYCMLLGGYGATQYLSTHHCIDRLEYSTNSVKVNPIDKSKRLQLLLLLKIMEEGIIWTAKH